MSIIESPAVKLPASASARAGVSYDQLVSSAIAQTASSAERMMAWLRAGLCALVLGGFLLNASTVIVATPEQAAIEFCVAFSAILFSIWVLHTTRRRVLSPRIHVVSVCVDAAICTAGLASNWLTLRSQYDGALSSLDIAIFPLTVMTSLFRLSPAAVLASGVATSAGLAFVIAVEARLGFPVRPDKAVLLAVYQAGAIAAALLFTRWCLSTLHGTSSASVRAERARSGLLALLTDHHDLRSGICDVRMNAERLHEELTSPERAAAGAELALSRNVTQGLVRMTESLHTTSERVLRVLDGSGDLQPTDVQLAVESAVQAFHSVFPDVSVEMRCVRGTPSVLFGGGDEVLAKLVTNLLVNAAEGNTLGAARHVSVEVTLAGRGRLALVIEDDGPGFPKELLDHLGQRGFSTKSRSSGLGLWLAESAVLAAGGRLQLQSGARGARVRIVLRTVA